MNPSSRPTSTSTRQGTSPMPRATLPPQDDRTKVVEVNGGRILCIADIRGKLSSLNDLAREANAHCIIHTGDFGFFEPNSLERINDRTLRHLTMYSPLIPSAQRTHLLSPENPPSVIRSTVDINLLSEFPLLLSGQIKLKVPVFTVWGACEDVSVLERFRDKTYNVENLTVLDEACTACIDIKGVKLRLLGLGGALVPHKMFDNGDGQATIAGGQGTMWTTLLQIGELVDTAQRVYDPSETRLLVTHASPGREGIMAQLALVLKADLTISAGLHFRYASSYNEFSVQGDFEGFRRKLAAGKEAFDRVWESVKAQVEAVIDDNQRVLLDKALSVIERVPSVQTNAGPGAALSGEEPAWKNCWNWNLCDAAYGWLVLDFKEGRVSAELKSQGFNYAYRRTATPGKDVATPTQNAPPTTTGKTPERNLPPHIANASKSGTSTPPTASTGRETPKDASAPKTNGTASPASAGPPSERAEREKAKKKEKKERKERERAEREAKEKAGDGADAAAADGGVVPKADSPPPVKPLHPPPAKSGKATPVPPEPSTSEMEPSGLKSPATDSGGIRTPTGGRPKRNPWTIFMRMQVPASEAEIKEYYGLAAPGVTRIHYPQTTHAGRSQKLAYVEFGDEEAMRAGLEKHAEKLNDHIPEIKQATDREPNQGGGRGGNPNFRGGRGRGGGFATRGFAAAGLMRGGRSNSNSDVHGPGGGDA